MIGSARIEPLIKLIAHCSAPWIFCFNNLLLMGDSKSFGTIWRDLKETKGQYLKGLYKTRSKKVKHEVWLKKVEEDRTLIGLACVRSMRGLYRQGNKTRLNTQKKKKKKFQRLGVYPPSAFTGARTLVQRERCWSLGQWGTYSKRIRNKVHEGYMNINRNNFTS